jgi:hypothetical protein
MMGLSSIYPPLLYRAGCTCTSYKSIHRTLYIYKRGIIILWGEIHLLFNGIFSFLLHPPCCFQREAPFWNMDVKCHVAENPRSAWYITSTLSLISNSAWKVLLLVCTDTNPAFIHTHTHTLPLFSFSPCYSLPPSFPSFLPRVINFFLFVRLFASSSFFFTPLRVFRLHVSLPPFYSMKKILFLCVNVKHPEK